MFDYIEDSRVKCPRCGSAEAISMQTKNIDPSYGGTMTQYTPHYRPRPGRACLGCKPFFPVLFKSASPWGARAHKLPPDHARRLRALATCESPTCRAEDRAIQLLTTGDVRNGSFNFEVDYLTNDDFIIGEPIVKVGPAKGARGPQGRSLARLSKQLRGLARRKAPGEKRWRASLARAGGDPLLAVLILEPAPLVPRRKTAENIRRAKGARPSRAPSA